MNKNKREYGPDLHIRLPMEVRAILELKALKNDQKLTEYIIDLILDRPIQYTDIAERMDETIEQIRRIGININQIARRENAGIFEAGDIRELRVCQARIEEEVLKLRNDLMEPEV